MDKTETLPAARVPTEDELAELEDCTELLAGPVPKVTAPTAESVTTDGERTENEAESVDAAKTYVPAGEALRAEPQDLVDMGRMIVARMMEELHYTTTH